MYNYEDTLRPTLMPSQAPSTSAPTTPAPTGTPTVSTPTKSPTSFPSKKPTAYVPEIPKFEFINLYPLGDAELFVAAALDDTAVTLPNGHEIILNAGDIYKGRTNQFDAVSADRPISVTGLVRNNRFEFVPLTNRAREFWFTDFRETPTLGIYALEDTSVNLTYRTAHARDNYLEWAQFDLSAGEFREEIANLTLAESALRWGLNFQVRSTGDVLVTYTGLQESNVVDLADFFIGHPGSSSIFGSMHNAIILNPDEQEYQLECSDGFVETTTEKRYQLSSSNAWEGPACRAQSASGSLLWAGAAADGSGYDAVSWLPSHMFGRQGVITTHMNSLFFVAEQPATCSVGDASFQLISNSTVFKYSYIPGGKIDEGSVISCDSPVGVWGDPRSWNDEGIIPMFNYEDPCDRCHTEKEFDPVCSPTKGGFDNECFALCHKVTDSVPGNCQPTGSPSTSGPTQTPTLYPTTEQPTEMPVPLYTTDQRMYVLQDLLAQTTRHVMLQQVQQEHDLRSRGSSGMTRIRSYRDGATNYLAEGSVVNGAMLTMHNHPDFPRTMGLGEFGAVLNGVRFDTRHNDYKIRKPSPEAIVQYNQLEDIEYPPVPQSVLDLSGNVTAQIEEMQLYFKAFKEQDESIRDYKEFFKPVMCYLEGGWIKNEELEDPFASDRHELDHDTWKALHEAQVFRANSGKKHILENTPFLPTKIIDVRLDPLNGISTPVFANFEYRIACQDFNEDIPTERFYIDGPEFALQKFARGATSIDEDRLFFSRAAHFKLHSNMPDEWEANKRNGRDQTLRPVTSRSYIDHLMEQIPGKDGPLGKLTDDSFKTPSTEYRKQENDLNTAFYSRFFSIREPDAMGRQDQMRGYNDGSLWASMTSHENVAGNTVCDDGDRTRNGDKECWTQKWTYAVPVEIVYLTPLENWNPCNLEERARNTQPAGRDGSEENPFLGWAQNMFSKTPYQFYESELGNDLADTGMGHFAEGQNGEVCYVISSGTKIITDNIGQSVGPVRLRYPIFPIHEQSNLAFREASAVKKTLTDEMERENAELRSEINQLQSEFEAFKNEIVNLIGTSSDFNELVNTVGTLTDGEPAETTTTTAAQQVGKWTEQTYPIAKLVSGPGNPEAHTHDVYCDWSCFLDLMEGHTTEVTSEDWDGHTHVFQFKLVEGSRVDLELTWCDSCTVDTHSTILIAGENTEVFLPFR